MTGSITKLVDALSEVISEIKKTSPDTEEAFSQEIKTDKGEVYVITVKATLKKCENEKRGN